MGAVKAKVTAATVGAAVAAVVVVLAAAGVTTGPTVVKSVSLVELAIDVAVVALAAFSSGYAKTETVGDEA